MSEHWIRTSVLYFLTLVALIAAGNTGHLPIARLAHSVPWGDKICHFVLMGILAFAVNMALGARPRRTVILVNLVLAALLLVEEFSQLWVRYRHFELLDLAADLAGLAFFGMAARYGSFGRADHRAPGCEL